MKNRLVVLVVLLTLAKVNSFPLVPTKKLSNHILSQYLEPVYEELNKELAYQNDDRTCRATREYGYSFFKMEQNDFTYVPPPQFLQELGHHICQAFGDTPVTFTNIILSYYGKGFHLEPHVDVSDKDRYGDCLFYFGEKVYGIVIEADSEGSLYFVRWEEGLRPPLGLQPIYRLPEESGTIFCLQDKLRKSPYFHGVSPVSKRRISITFRTVVKI